MQLQCFFNNHSDASSKWVGNGPEPRSRIISYTCQQYQSQNQSNLEASLLTIDICSLCHALSNQHHYNLSNDLLFCMEIYEIGDKDARDSIAVNLDNSLVYDPSNWDSDEEIMGSLNVQSKKSLTTHVHVPACN